MRTLAIKELEIMAGLRGLEELVQREVTGMPILNDIMDHKVLGPNYRAGVQQGREERREERRAEGERNLVFRQMERRFGPCLAGQKSVWTRCLSRT